MRQPERMPERTTYRMPDYPRDQFELEEVRTKEPNVRWPVVERTWLKRSPQPFAASPAAPAAPAVPVASKPPSKPAPGAPPRTKPAAVARVQKPAARTKPSKKKADPGPKPLPAPVASSAVALKPPAAQPQPPAPNKPFVSTGVVIFHDDAPDAPPPAAPKPTTGVIVFHETPALVPTPAAVKTSRTPPTTLTPAQLRQRVLAVCGGVARDVQVTVQPDSSLEVKVRVATAEAERALASKVLQIPEMLAPNVRLAVEIVP